VGVDRLGAIQNLLGPDVANDLVQHVGRAVATMVRASDIVARLDDDRVMALLVRAPGPSALKVAEKICRTVAQTSSAVVELPGASVSIGVAEFPSNALNVYSLLDAADDALTRAQSRGRNRAVLAASRPAPPPSGVKAPAGRAPARCP
jgi:diguanylate cyclase (GGDEF)-like protein